MGKKPPHDHHTRSVASSPAVTLDGGDDQRDELLQVHKVHLRGRTSHPVCGSLDCANEEIQKVDTNG